MGTDIHGWVEVKIREHWHAAIRLDPLLERNYHIFNLLFGARNGNYEAAIAGKRGMSEGVSYEVKNWVLLKRGLDGRKSKRSIGLSMKTSSRMIGVAFLRC